MLRCAKVVLGGQYYQNTFAAHDKHAALIAELTRYSGVVTQTQSDPYQPTPKLALNCRQSRLVPHIHTRCSCPWLRPDQCLLCFTGSNILHILHNLFRTCRACVLNTINDTSPSKCVRFGANCDCADCWVIYRYLYFDQQNHIHMYLNAYKCSKVFVSQDNLQLSELKWMDRGGGGKG